MYGSTFPLHLRKFLGKIKKFKKNKKQICH